MFNCVVIDIDLHVVGIHEYNLESDNCFAVSYTSLPLRIMAAHAVLALIPLSKEIAYYLVCTFGLIL